MPPKDDLNKTIEQLAKELRKENKGVTAGKTNEEAKAYFKEMAKMRKKDLEEQKKLDQKKREQEIKDALMQRKGMTQSVAETMAKTMADAANKEDDARQERDKSFFRRLQNTMSPKKSAEEIVEKARREKSFFKSLTGIFKSKKDGDEKGDGIFGGAIKTIKKVFNLIKGKFLLIGALVVGLISQMNMEQLKKTWESLKVAFDEIWKFLDPIVTKIWEWVTDTAIPALVDGLINSFKSVGELFKNLKEKFSGFTEMSWVERMWAILDAFKDIGSFLGDMIGNFAVTVEKMFGGDGTWITGIWNDIKGFFNSIWDWLKLAFTDPMAAMKQMWDGITGGISSIVSWVGENWLTPAWNAIKEFFSPEITILKEMWTGLLEGATELGSWLKLKLLDPIVEWFNDTFSFGSFKEVLASIVTAIFLPEQIIKDVLLNPAAKWLGEVFGFDSSGFTDFSIGQLFTKSMDNVVKFFNDLFNIDIYAIFSDILGKAGAIGKKIWNYFKGEKKQATPPPPPPPSDTRSDKEKMKDYGRWSFTPEGKAFMDAEGAKNTTQKKNAYRKWLSQQSKPQLSGELQQIQADEGFEAGVYEDTMGIKTIGYGFNLERAGSQEALDAAGIKKSLSDLKGGKAKLTKEEASRLMMGEMGHFKGVAERFVGTATWNKLSPNRQGILTNMAYNMGEGTLSKFKNLRASIQKGDWKQAQVEMRDSTWAGQVKGRADRLIARMGADEKSQNFAQIQSANLARDNNGNPIMVTQNFNDQSVKSVMGETTMVASGDARNNSKMGKVAKG